MGRGLKREGLSVDIHGSELASEAVMRFASVWMQSHDTHPFGRIWILFGRLVQGLSRLRSMPTGPSALAFLKAFRTVLSERLAGAGRWATVRLLRPRFSPRPLPKPVQC
jgi:hypothetical protein